MAGLKVSMASLILVLAGIAQAESPQLRDRQSGNTWETSAPTRMIPIPPAIPMGGTGANTVPIPSTTPTAGMAAPTATTASTTLMPPILRR